MHRLFKVDGVEDFDAVSFLQKGVAYLQNCGAFRVCENIGTVHLEKIRLDPEASLAAARPAHDEHVFIARRLGVLGAAGHGETLGLGQDDVVLEFRGHVRLNVLGIAPAGRSVFTTVAVFFCVFAFEVNRQPQSHAAAGTHRQIQRVKAGDDAAQCVRQNSHQGHHLFGEVSPDGQSPGIAQIGSIKARQHIGQVQEHKPLCVLVHRSARSCFFSRILPGTSSAASALNLANCSKMLGRSSFFTTRAEYSLKAAVKVSASRALKKTR